MSSRVHLPTVRTLGAVRIPSGPPTVDDARASLGGRASTDPRAGVCVSIVERGGVRTTGIVVFASGEERDVWVGEGRFRRADAASCEPAETATDDSLDAIAEHARRFAALSEGDAVRYLDRDDHAHEGQLVEKCRYGALVLAPDGRVLAVGFRRISAAVT